MGSVIMSTIKNNAQNTPKNYDAGDMADVHLLAKQHLSWVSALVSTVIRNNKTDKTFHNKELLEVAQYLSESFANDHDLQCEGYQAEWDANKKVVIL